jgi:hypothetical protein
MKPWILFFTIVALTVTTAGMAQPPSPKPAAETKKLATWSGEWTYEGESKESPLGPAGNFSGKVTCRMTLGGFFLDCRWEEKGPTGQIRGVEIDGFDSVNKVYSTHSFSSDGGMGSGSITIKGNTWTFLVDVVQAGKQLKARSTAEFSPDGMNFTGKSEISSDGKTWTLLGESKGTKTPPAAKPPKETK